LTRLPTSIFQAIQSMAEVYPGRPAAVYPDRTTEP
jgi:hypothetical protein